MTQNVEFSIPAFFHKSCCRIPLFFQQQPTVWHGKVFLCWRPRQVRFWLWLVWQAEAWQMETRDLSAQTPLPTYQGKGALILCHDPHPPT
jgi:hypothetical protein